jgi:hypothetical protein
MEAIVGLAVLAGLVLFLLSLRKGSNSVGGFRDCPKCGKSDCLEYHGFVVTDKVVGHNRTRIGGGRRGSIMRGGFFSGLGRTRDEPFIREWGEDRYICRACGRKVAFQIRRDR